MFSCLGVSILKMDISPYDEGISFQNNNVVRLGPNHKKAFFSIFVRSDIICRPFRPVFVIIVFSNNT
jgi:hypothetical protein